MGKQQQKHKKIRKGHASLCLCALTADVMQQQQQNKGIELTFETKGNATYACAKDLWVVTPFRLPMPRDSQETAAAVTEPAAVDEARRLDGLQQAPTRLALTIDSGCADEFLELVQSVESAVASQDFSIDARLRRGEEAIDAAEEIFRMAIADSPPQTVSPLLVAALRNAPTLFGLRSTLADAVLWGGDDAANRCLDVALRIETLGRSCARLAKDVRARKAMQPVVDYLVDAVGMRAQKAFPNPVRHQSITYIASSDAWMPVLDIARVAGRTCSAMLLQRAHTEIRRRADECTRTLDASSLVQEQAWLPDRPLHYYASIAMLALKASAKGMCNPMRALESGCDWMALCRCAVRPIARTLRRAIEIGLASAWAMPKLKPINKVRKTVALAIVMATGDRRNALVYVLCLLTTIAAAYGGRDDTEDDTATQKVGVELRDPTGPSRAIALEGLDIAGVDEEDTDNSEPETHAGDSVEPVPHHRQDDLLSRAWEHHPDLFTVILGHVDPWDVGSVALASRTHYMRIVKALRDQDCDGAEPDGGLVGTTLSATIWLQRNLDGRVYEPAAERIEPPPEQGALPDLRLLLFLCRFMARLDGASPKERKSKSITGLAVACVLQCGGAIARCIGQSGFNECPSVFWQRREHEERTEQLAGEAGFRASPLAMRVAIAESFRAAAWSELCPQDSAPSIPIRHTLSIVDNTVDGVMRRLRDDDMRTHRGQSGDLSGLVNVFCAFLTGVRHDMEAGRTGVVWDDRLARTFCTKAMALLAPGTPLREPLLRTRLALALFEASRPIRLRERPHAPA